MACRWCRNRLRNRSGCKWQRGRSPTGRSLPQSGSPLQRARETARRAVPGVEATVVDALAEYDYGDYEGLTSAEIDTLHPGWELFKDGCPGGESLHLHDRGIARSVRGDHLDLDRSATCIVRREHVDLAGADEGDVSWFIVHHYA